MRRSTLHAPRHGRGICFARIAALATELAVDLEALGRRSVVITGTNGKGSTATILASLMRCAHRRVGLFTSPHVYAFNERFCLDGEPISDTALGALEAEVAAAADRLGDGTEAGDFGEFELWFMTACLYFTRSRAGFCIFEAGIGGRYDPTRALQCRLAAITSIDLEHTELLGESEELILFDKADIVAAGGTLVLGASLGRLDRQTGAYCRLRDVRAELASQSVSEPLQDAEGCTVRAGALDIRFTPRLAGDHQGENYQTALALFLKAARPDAQPDPVHLGEALSNAFLPGRFETIANAPPLIVDFGHTPAALQAIARHIEFQGLHKGAVLLLGVSAKRALEPLLVPVVPLFDRIVTGPSLRGHDPETLRAACRAIRPDADIHAFSRLDEAYAFAVGSGASRVIVLGGYFWGAAVRAFHFHGEQGEIEF